MKKMFKNFLSIALLLAATTAVASDNSSKDITCVPFYNQRSQGNDLARYLVGEVFFKTRCDTECLSGDFSATAEYTQTFRQNRLASALSFNGTNQMVFSTTPGTGVDVLAQEFLIPANNPDFTTGTLTLKPRIQNFILDLNLRLNLDEWMCGMFFEIGLPIDWTRWNLGLEDNVNGAIVNSFVGNTTSAAQGVTAPMTFATVNGRRTKTAVADLRFVLGYNLWCTDCGHFGVSLRVQAPTGTRPNAEFFFEPIAGNGHHTTVGAGITSHWMLWENNCDQSFSVWFDAEVHHLFKTKQRRTFDLANAGARTGLNNCGSRYLLLKQFNAAGDVVGTVRGPNVLTQDVKVSIGAEGEALLLFDYQHCGWTFDFGYNLWGRTKEKLSLDQDPLAANTFAVAFGDATSVATATTTATIANLGAGDCPNEELTGCPVFLTQDMIDINGGAFKSTLSHKVFGHISYAWDCCDYAPFIGVGGYGEFSGRGNRALNQWAVWAKGGFAFS